MRAKFAVISSSCSLSRTSLENIGSARLCRLPQRDLACRNLLHGSPSGLASGQAPVRVHGVEHLLNGFRPVRMGEDPELL